MKSKADSFDNNDDEISKGENTVDVNVNWDKIPDDNYQILDIPDDDAFWDQLTEDESSIPTERQDGIINARQSDNQIINFITNFVENQDKTIKQKHKLKKIFFGIIMIIFVIVTTTSVFVIFAVDSDNTIAFMAGIIAAITQTLASIIILPKIVAEYLFNKEEDVAH